MVEAMPNRSFSLYNPVLAIGPPTATLTLIDADDKLFEATGDTNGNNQSAELDGFPVTVNSIQTALTPRLVVALVDGVEISVRLTAVRVVIEDGLFDDTYIMFPGLPPGASILSVSLPLFGGEVAIPLCLSGDTPIKTVRGPKNMNDVEVGDQVFTKGNGVQTVRWVGKRKVDFRNNDAMRKHLPVVFERNALGKNRPHKRLRVSPHHRMLVEHWRAELLFGECEVFAFAKSLVNGDTVWIDYACETIEYVHLLFDQHEVIFAAGTPVESLHPGKEALTHMDRQAREEILELFPELIDITASHQTARRSLKHFEAQLLAAAG